MSRNKLFTFIWVFLVALGGFGVFRWNQEIVMQRILSKIPVGVMNWNNFGNNSRFAFVMYASNYDYFCHALVNAEFLLHEFNTTVDVVIMLTPSFIRNPDKLWKNYNLSSQFDDQQLKLKLLDTPPNFATAKWSYYRHCYRKLQVFSLYREYDRVVFLDSDGLVMKNLDYLFELDWTGHNFAGAYARYPKNNPRNWLTSAFFGADLSETTWDEVSTILTNSTELNFIQKKIKKTPYDMEVINYIFNRNQDGNNTFVLPSSQVRLDAEFQLLFSYNDEDSKSRLNKTIYVHFSNEKPFYKGNTRTYKPSDPYKRLFHKFWKFEAKMCRK